LEEPAVDARLDLLDRRRIAQRIAHGVRARPRRLRLVIRARQTLPRQRGAAPGPAALALSAHRVGHGSATSACGRPFRRKSRLNGPSSRPSPRRPRRGPAERPAMSAPSALTSTVYGELPFRTAGLPVLMERMTASKSLASVQ